MSGYDTHLLRRIENLIRSFKVFVDDAEGTPEEEQLLYGLRALVAFTNMIINEKDIFELEPWHVINKEAPLSMPGEMLLRVKDYRGEPIPPYPAIMAFYKHGYTTQIDTILFMAALSQFERSDEKQVSINVSSRSFRDPDFVRTALERLENMARAPDEKIIIEIHESTSTLSMIKQVLQLFRQSGVAFAIDDIGLSMNDVMRLAEFDGIANYIKIDRHAVCAKPDEPNALQNVMSFLRTMLPGTIAVAEGVKTVEHAQEIHKNFPDIGYVQGLYLPNRDTFQQEWSLLNK